MRTRRTWLSRAMLIMMLVLALVLSVTSSLLALYGPKLSGRAINAIEPGAGKVDFDAIVPILIKFLMV